MVSCPRLGWITNSSDQRKVWTANILHGFGVPGFATFRQEKLIWAEIKGSQFKSSCGHLNLWSIEISSITPSQSQTWLEAEVSHIRSVTPLVRWCIWVIGIPLTYYPLWHSGLSNCIARGLRIKLSYDKKTLRSIQISSTIPSQFQTSLEVEVSLQLFSKFSCYYFMLRTW